MDRVGGDRDDQSRPIDRHSSHRNRIESHQTTLPPSTLSPIFEKHTTQGGNHGASSDDHDAARVAEIEKEAAYEAGLFHDNKENANNAAGNGENAGNGKNGTATGQGLGPIGTGAAAAGATAGAGAEGQDGGLRACCANYWKGYSTGWTLVGVGLLIMALSGLIRGRFDKMYLAKLEDKLAVTSMEEVGEMRRRGGEGGCVCVCSLKNVCRWMR